MLIEVAMQSPGKKRCNIEMLRIFNVLKTAVINFRQRLLTFSP